MRNLQSYLDLREMLAGFLTEDIGRGDITGDILVSPSITANAEIVCKSLWGIVCGVEEAAIVFDICGCECKTLAPEGSEVERGDIIMQVSGDIRSVLKAERTALNILMRMSGIATQTRRFVNVVGGKSIKVASTRKTAPGLRYLDKKAVIAGGGWSHRMALDDMVLIKDNHLAVTGSVRKSVEDAKKNSRSSAKVECEVKNLREAVAAVRAGADIIMLDNFSVNDAIVAVRRIAELGLRDKVTIEISGGINLENIGQYAYAKPDIISVGLITHSPQAVDFSLELRS